MVTYIGSSVIQAYYFAVEFINLIVNTGIQVVKPPYKISDIFKQIYLIGNKSVVIIAFCVASAAVVTIIESSFHMKIVIQNDSLVPGFASLLILRELGVVVMALLLTSKIGAGMTAEIGSMKITEQIEALKMLGIDPVNFLVVPRLIGCTIAGALLSIIANIVCLTSAYFVSQLYLGFTSGSFLTAMRTFVEFNDLIFATIKGAAFCSVIPLISCFHGFRCEAGAEGVGTATTQSVVHSSIAIIILDFILSYIFTYFY